jgi:hypothetical protein
LPRRAGEIGELVLAMNGDLTKRLERLVGVPVEGI